MLPTGCHYPILPHLTSNNRMSEQNKPLLSDDMIELFNDAKALDCDNNMSEDAAFHFVNGHLAGMNEISGIYEQARTKDRELIQTLVNALAEIGSTPTNCGDPNFECPLHDLGKRDHAITAALALAGEQGHKPTLTP